MNVSFLATKQNVSASTQNQALNAIIFLYKHVLGIELGAYLPDYRYLAVFHATAICEDVEIHSRGNLIMC